MSTLCPQLLRMVSHGEASAANSNASIELAPFGQAKIKRIPGANQEERIEVASGGASPAAVSAAALAAAPPWPTEAEMS